ncbi:MAG: glycosyltransferase family 2 protein [Nitrospirota bacterium]
MKFSIITAVFNNSSFIEFCLRSVMSQTYPHIEHIIIDGGSTDGTLDIILRFTSSSSRIGAYDSLYADHPITDHLSRVPRLISEPDNGIYDALNKGIRMATGEIIGFLHADDLYADESVIEKVSEVMSQSNRESCYGDLIYVNKNNTEKIIRHWRSCPYQQGLFQKGWMPPHPTFFVKRRVYEKYGLFNTDFRIAADYELMLRFLGKHRISTFYIPEVLIKMRVGGASNRSIPNLIRKSSEDYRAIRMHGIGRFPTLFRKNLSKIPQFFKKQ